MGKKALTWALSLILLAGLGLAAAGISLAQAPDQERSPASLGADPLAARATQGRTLKRIKTVESAELPDEVAAIAADLPERQQCVDAAYDIAAAYGADVESVLHEDFPNRAEFINALQRSALRVSSLELAVESVEAARIQPWQLLGSEEGDDNTVYTLVSDCIVDIRMRVVFDGSTSGQRAVSDVVRGEWRIRFTSEATVQGPDIP